MLGWETYLASPADVLDLLPEVAPQVFMCVPAYWEKIARAIGAPTAIAPRRARSASPAAACGSASPAAPASRSRSRSCSTRCGVLIIEGYGLTETSPTLTLNRPDAFRFDTVGKPLPSVELKLAEDGEILARGPNVFAGYYKDPAATAAAFTEDGWFSTGDVGRCTDDGFLQIIDRKKDILVTAGGKNVPPANIEAKFVDDPVIERVVVYGDARPYLVAAVWLRAGASAPDERAARSPAQRASTRSTASSRATRRSSVTSSPSRRSPSRTARSPVAQAAPQGGLRAPARPLRGALRVMKAPKKTPLDSIVALAQARAEGPAAVGATPHSVVWTREQVAPAALRAGGAPAVRDAGPARAVADQPLVRARPRARAAR